MAPEYWSFFSPFWYLALMSVKTADDALFAASLICLDVPAPVGDTSEDKSRSFFCPSSSRSSSEPANLPCAQQRQQGGEAAHARQQAGKRATGPSRMAPQGRVACARSGAPFGGLALQATSSVYMMDQSKSWSRGPDPGKNVIYPRPRRGHATLFSSIVRGSR